MGENAKLERHKLDSALRFHKRTFQKDRDTIENLLRQSPDDEGNVRLVRSLIDESMEPARKQCEEIIQRIIINFLNPNDKDFSKEEEKYWAESDKIKYDAATIKAKADVFCKSLREEIAQRHPLNDTTEQRAPVSATPICPQLPAIPVPKYDGEYSRFYDFKNLFTSLIHENTKLTPIEKLWFLKCSLVGELKDFLKDFELSDKAYAEAWEYFLERRENRK